MNVYFQAIKGLKLDIFFKNDVLKNVVNQFNSFYFEYTLNIEATVLLID
jgi:hypothetical protein